ncbi:EAL domain-containing protein [Pseudoalteromonas phenolica]|uniref:EAL domain-containing protein n=1 Tax=Pseudoalteromonas phenolica TaxID=161398 RepID=UPI00384F1CC9
MHLKPYLILTFTFFLLSFSSHSSQQIYRLSTEEGLSQANVNNIVQDELGYIWIATEQGLNRYDGIDVSLPAQIKNLLNEQIYQIQLIDEVNLLVSTSFDGTYLIDTKTLEKKKIYSGRLADSQNFTSPINTALKVGKNLYAAIDNHVYKISLVTYESKLIGSVDSGHLVRAFLNIGNTLYVGSSDGLYSLSVDVDVLTKHRFLEQSLENELNQNVKLLKYDSEQGLLIGTVEGLFVSPTSGNSFDFANTYTLVKSLNIWDHESTAYGEFIATELGLYKIDRNTRTANNVLALDKSKYKLNQPNILALELDENNVLWMATHNGAYYWPLSSLLFNTIKQSGTEFINNNIWAIYQLPDNSILYGTDNGIAHIPSLAEKHDATFYFQSKDKKDVYGSNAVYHIFQTDNNSDTVYLDTIQGLKVFDLKTKTISAPKVVTSTIENPFNVLNSSSTSINQDEIAFIGEDDYFIYNVKNKSVSPIKGLAEQLPMSSAYRFLKPLPTHPNEILVSSLQGLYLFSQESKKLTPIYEFKKADDKTFQVVDDWEIVNESLWLTTSHNGLIELNLKDFSEVKVIDESYGLDTQALYEVMADPYGFLWFSAQTGLFRYEPDTGLIEKFGINNGLPNNEFNAGASLKLNNQHFAFGTVSGITWFDTADFIENKSIIKTPLSITDINIMSNEFNFYPDYLSQNKLSLQHDDVGLEIKFSNFDFSHQRNSVFVAELTGSENVSLTNLSKTKLFFPRLAPGNYNITIKELALDGETLIDSITLPVEVEYYFLNSPAAWILYFIAISSILLLSYRQGKSRQMTIQKALLAVTTSKQQTEMALKSTKSGTWKADLRKQLIYQYRNKTTSRECGQQNELPLDDFIELIHPEDRQKVASKWALLDSSKNQNINLTYRLQNLIGEWLWFQDIGQVTERDDNGKPLVVSGIYSNITESKATNLQASILGQAFSQIDEWLLILDTQLNPLAVNQSFCDAFDLNEADALSELSFLTFAKILGKKKLRQLINKISDLKANQNFKMELTVETNKHRVKPIHVSVNAIANDTGVIEHFVIVMSDLTEQKKAENELRYLANYDSLTNLPNRNLMLQHIEFAIFNSQNNNTTCALLFIDLDKFKPINDAYGHQAGDKLLIKISQRINSLLPEHCILGRQSGDEFLVLVKDVTSPESLTKLTAELINVLPEKIDLDGISVSVSASVGVALYPFDAKSSEELIRHADIAMFQAKQLGRNGYKYFTTSMIEQYNRKMVLETALKTAYKDSAFFNHYQPIINTSSGQMIGVELLLRWQHNGENISPVDFIPIAEETGLIELMTEQALKRALVELSPLFDRNSQFYLSLNLSPIHIIREETAENLCQILSSYQLPTSRLRLEITETSLMEDKEKAKSSLNMLKKAGFKLLLDDFGTGYSSLTYLNQFPIDIIKIDQSFVRKMDEQHTNKSIVKTIHSLARNLNMFCIAEGVETPAQLKFLTDLGCNYMQGYLFSKPLPIEQLLLKEQNTTSWR